MIVQVLTVVLNAVLAPVLIAVGLTGHPLGVAGAGWQVRWRRGGRGFSCDLLSSPGEIRAIHSSAGARGSQPGTPAARRASRGEFALMFVFMG